MNGRRKAPAPRRAGRPAAKKLNGTIKTMRGKQRAKDRATTSTRRSK